MSKGEKCNFCEYDRGPLVGRHDLCATCHHFDNFKLKKRMPKSQANDYARIKKLEELADNKPANFDRDTALMVLQDFIPYMHPSTDIFGRKTLVISRAAFEAIRHKYLDNQEKKK